MMRLILMMTAVAGLAACSQSASDGNSAANASLNAPTAKADGPKHPTYCFYKDSATKGWSASRDKAGNVVVKGKAHLDDAAYRAQLDQGEVQGDKASVWLIMGPNSSYASPDGWWDVDVAIQNSASAKSVDVMCGTKTVASLPLKG